MIEVLGYLVIVAVMGSYIYRLKSENKELREEIYEWENLPDEEIYELLEEY